MKTNEFKCPLHYNNPAIITCVSTHIDGWDNYICKDCADIKKIIDKIEYCLSHSNSKLENSIKKMIKTNQLIYFEANNFDNDLLHKTINKVSYFENQILLQELYQCGFITKRYAKLDWRLRYQTQKTTYTIDIPYTVGDNVPFFLLDDY